MSDKNSKQIFILDTNILLDILVFDEQKAHPLREALDSQYIDAVATQRTIDEFADVISRAQFGLNEQSQSEILKQWLSWCRVMADESIENAPWKCKDRDDQIFINLSYTLRPSILLSKDKQVLKIAKRAIKENIVITSDHEKILLSPLQEL
jgi:predicted nucleic acid-binding protein